MEKLLTRLTDAAELLLELKPVTISNAAAQRAFLDTGIAELLRIGTAVASGAEKLGLTAEEKGKLADGVETVRALSALYDPTKAPKDNAATITGLVQHAIPLFEQTKSVLLRTGRDLELPIESSRAAPSPPLSGDLYNRVTQLNELNSVLAPLVGRNELARQAAVDAVGTPLIQLSQSLLNDTAGVLIPEDRKRELRTYLIAGIKNLQILRDTPSDELAGLQGEMAMLSLFRLGARFSLEVSEVELAEFKKKAAEQGMTTDELGRKAEQFLQRIRPEAPPFARPTEQPEPPSSQNERLSPGTVPPAELRRGLFEISDLALRLEPHLRTNALAQRLFIRHVAEEALSIGRALVTNGAQVGLPKETVDSLRSTTTEVQDLVSLFNSDPKPLMRELSAVESFIQVGELVSKTGAALEILISKKSDGIELVRGNQSSAVELPPLEREEMRERLRGIAELSLALAPALGGNRTSREVMARGVTAEMIKIAESLIDGSAGVTIPSSKLRPFQTQLGAVRAQMETFENATTHAERSAAVKTIFEGTASLMNQARELIQATTAPALKIGVTFPKRGDVGKRSGE